MTYEISQPLIATQTLEKLFENGKMRAQQLVDNVGPNVGASRSLIYSVIDELVENGLIHKDKRSRKIVVYDLTEEGQKLIQENFIKATESLIAMVERSDQSKEIALEILTESSDSNSGHEKSKEVKKVHIES